MTRPTKRAKFSSMTQEDMLEYIRVLDYDLDQLYTKFNNFIELAKASFDNLTVLVNEDLATERFAFRIINNGTPVDGAGRVVRVDGCTIASTKDPLADEEAGFIGINVDGTQQAIPYYDLS